MKSPDFHPHVHEIRTIAFKELTYFIEEKILTEFQLRGDDALKDLTLLCGDFNTNRDPLNEHVLKFLFSINGGWVDHFTNLDNEYNNLLNSLKLDGVFHVVNLWDQ